MAAEYDSTEFVDTDFQAHKSPLAASGGDPLRAPTRDEVDRRVVEAQQKLAELKRAQDSLERERASLEELRRRQAEFQTGRQEVVHNLTRGLGLLEESEFNTRREAEQMLKTIADFRSALAKIESVHEESWTKENFSVELTRGLTAVENARMEWNAARLKTAALSPEALKKTESEDASPAPALALTQLSFGDLCKLGLAFTWPLMVVALVALGIFVAVLLRR